MDLETQKKNVAAFDALLVLIRTKHPSFSDKEEGSLSTCIGYYVRLRETHHPEVSRQKTLTFALTPNTLPYYLDLYVLNDALRLWQWAVEGMSLPAAGTDK